MSCLSLPQRDYDQFSRDVCEAIRVDHCEHVWAEPINIRSAAMPRTLASFQREGLWDEAEMVQAVHGPGAGAAWEDYVRATFLAHTRNIPVPKLRFVQYVSMGTAPWWKGMRSKEAILLGSDAKKLGLCEPIGGSAP